MLRRMRGSYPEHYRERAEELRSRGWGARKIGRHLGVPRDRIRDWLNPERRRRLARSEAKRRKVPCLGCGKPKCPPMSGKAEDLCKPCQEARADERRARIIELWAEGVSIIEIAADLGTTKNSICVDIARIRRRPNGYELLPLRYAPRA